MLNDSCTWLRESNNGGLSEMQGIGGARCLQYYYHHYYYYPTTTEQEAEGGPNDVPDALSTKNPQVPYES